MEEMADAIMDEAFHGTLLTPYDKDRRLTITHSQKLTVRKQPRYCHS